MPVATPIPVVTIKNIPRLCQMSLGMERWENSRIQVRTTNIDQKSAQMPPMEERVGATNNTALQNRGQWSLSREQSPFGNPTLSFLPSGIFRFCSRSSPEPGQ